MDADVTSTKTKGYFLQDFSTSAFDFLREFHQRRELCDVVLCVDKKRISAHRVILAASSPYFRAMFSGKMAESCQDEIILSGLDGMALQHIVDFFYTGKMDIDQDNVQSLLYASCLLAVSSVKQYCCDFLEHEICAANCLGIRAIADTFSCAELFSVADSYVTANFTQVLQCEEFMLLPYESIKELVKRDYLGISGEVELLNGVLNWLHWDANNRGMFAISLLKSLHLMQVSACHLQSLLNDSMISSQSECVDLLLEQIQALESKSVVKAYEFPIFMNRKYGKAKEVLLAIGGESAGVILDTVECFDIESMTWDWSIAVNDTEPVPLSKLYQQLNYATSCATGRHVYVIGGSASWKALDVVQQYEWPDNKWQIISPLNEDRLGAGSAVIDGQLIVAGGCGSHGYLSSVEVYDPLTDAWKLTSPMKVHRSYLGVSSLNGYIYAVGGYGSMSGTKENWLASMECYIPSSDTWISSPSMLHARAYYGLVAEKGSLYALGGYNGSWLKSAERYDPREGQWYSIASMKTGRASGGACAINNSIYITGGFDGIKNLNSVEMLDVRAGKWTTVNPMRSVRFGMSLIPLRI